MHALAGQRIEIGREGRDKRFAFTGLHLGDVALVQEIPAHQLHVEGPEAQRPFRTLSAVRECLGQDVVKVFAIRDALAELLGLLNKPLVAQRGEFLFERIDAVHDGLGRPDLAVVRGPEHLFRDRSKSKHSLLPLSAGLTRMCEGMRLPVPLARHRRGRSQPALPLQAM